MSTLPTTWVETNLGAVVPYGTTVKAEPEDLTPDTWVLELEDIEKDTTKVLQRLTFADRQSKSTKNRFDAGDVLYGKLRPYLNKVTFAKEAGVCTTEIVPIKPNDAVNGRYLFHWLRHPKFLNYVTDVSHGVNMPRLGTDAGRQAPFVLAPKNEQKRIADKLDTVLTRVDAVNTRLARVAPLLKRFHQSVLAAATSGRLTAEVTDDDCNVTWPQIRLAALCQRVSVGHVGVTSQYYTTAKDGVPFLRSQNVRPGHLDMLGLVHITPAFHKQLKKSQLQPGDLLVVRVGANRGDACVIPTTAVGELNCANVVFARPDLTKALPKFLEIFFTSPACQEQLLASSVGGAQGVINTSVVGSIEVPLPTIKVQTEIVRRVETLFAFADRLEARLQTAQTAADRLTPSLLAKAFRGELVPQDPNDEPASELLKRLAASAPASASKRGRAKSSTAA